MYSIVNFFERNEVAVVPTIWFRDQDSMCAWPPFKHERLTRAVIRGEVPLESWTWYDAKILRMYGKS